jgi:general secretion pathway protein G
MVEIRRRRRDEGFTLVEIMVVVIILGLLATMGTIGVRAALEKAKVKTTQARCKELEDTVETFTLDHNANQLPTGEDMWEFLLGEGALKDKRVPKDAWGGVFRVNRLDDGNFEVWSMGKDGSADTEDDVFRDGLRKDRNQNF